MLYLNVDEVESALAIASAGRYAGFTTLIPLLEPSREGRSCHAIKIANGNDPGRPGVFLLGGIHADEWLGPDILVHFVELLTQHYHDGTDIILGGKRFSAADIRTIVDTLDIYVFPQANPDGRHYSQTVPGSSDWRKNRRTVAPNSNVGDCVGVDLNRNFDILWNFAIQFAPDAAFVSDDPCDALVYHGDAAFSEPETRNVRWIHDQYPNIGFFVDVHSAGPRILYSWSDDDNQSVDAGMNFREAAYDGLRGRSDALGQQGAYLEYIPGDDSSAAIDLAQTMSAAIQAVRGTSYPVLQGAGLYPTSGTSDDYAYSRHFVDGTKRNVLAFTIECGSEPQPLDPEKQDVIAETMSGLLALCSWVRVSIEACSLITDRSSFGKDEVDGMLALSAPASFVAAFHVVIDGFRPEELGVTAATLAGVPNVQPMVTFTPALNGVTARATACSAFGDALAEGPQRFTWTFAIDFADTADFTAEVLPVTMSAALAATTGVTMSASAVIHLTVQPRPFETDGSVSWLSVDLQVCQVPENGSLPRTPTIVLDAGPIDFIGRLLAAYNDPSLPRAPGHPFDIDLVANQATSTVEIAGSVGSPATPVHNFALARVRYNALATPAANVRVFFRMFQASTTSTDYQPSTTYPTGGVGGNRIPLPGVASGDIVSIPFFAAPRVDPTNPDGLDAQTDPPNVGPLGGPIPPDGTGAEVQAYFGCWLDVNQNVAVLPASPVPTSGPFTPTRSIQQIVKGQHQCLVAEIQLDPPAPAIATGATPASSDRLAQRNLTVVGVASPHLVPVPFEMKPTAALLRPGATPDELMLDWRSLPRGARATIFLPGVGAKQIVATADRLYRHHGWTCVDDHTLGCAAAGVSYLPIPSGAGPPYAGLMTIDLPPVVHGGKSFTVVARQLTRAFGLAPVPPRAAATVGAASRPRGIEWRRVIGSFQVSIPVKTRIDLLEPERRLLSVLRFIASSIPHADRWHPVFRRYLEQIAGRVDALGGDATRVGPSSQGDWRAVTRCGRWAVATAILIGALIAALGALTGSAIAMVVPPVALALIVDTTLWIRDCRPGGSSLFLAFVYGLGVAATSLALLALAGWSSPQLVSVLASSIVLLAVTIVIGRMSKWL